MSNNLCPYGWNNRISDPTTKDISWLVITHWEQILKTIREAQWHDVKSLITDIEQTLNDVLTKIATSHTIPKNPLIYAGIWHAVRNILRLLDVYHQLWWDVSKNGETWIREIVYQLARIPMAQLWNFSHELKINEDLINKVKSWKIDSKTTMQHLPYVADHFIIDSMKLYFSDEIERYKPELSGLCSAIGVRENMGRKDSALFLDKMIWACIDTYVSNVYKKT